MVFGQSTSLSSYVERMRIDPSGNLGVGVTAPVSILDVNGAITSRPFGASTGQTGMVKFYELAANGTESFVIRAPDSISSPLVWTLPATAPAAGNILTTDAEGNLSWISGAFGDLRSDGTVVMTAPMQFASGTATAPSITFSGDLDTGLFRPGANVLGVSVGGQNTFNFSSAGMNSTLTRGAAVSHAVSTASVPAYGFVGVAGAGMYAPAADTLAFSTSGVERMIIMPGGKVGIGTSANNFQLEVGGDIFVNGVKVGRGAGSGADNVAVGDMSLSSNTSGNTNTAIGRFAMQQNVAGSNNTAVGWQALSNNMNSGGNTAIGRNALLAATAGNNTAVGTNAGSALTTGNTNVFVGFNAGAALTTGVQNTFLGPAAGSSVTTGGNNVILGGNSGSSIATLSNHILLSDGAGTERLRIDGAGNVGVGTQSPSSRLVVYGTSSNILRLESNTIATSLTMSNSSVLRQLPLITSPLNSAF